MSPRFFGNSKHPLFGIYHPPRGGNTANPQAVLLCPPIGHELVRTHWAMRSLASKLAREGLHLFRFDYRGTGDSSDDVSEVSSLQTWVDDVCEAAAELQASSGAASINLVGLRLGATLATLAARQLAQPANNINVSKLILWEPVIDGTDYLTELRTMHSRMVDLWVSPVETENSDQHEEILGFRYTRQWLGELQSVSLPEVWRELPKSSVPQLVVSNGTPNQAAWSGVAPENLNLTEDIYDWNDLNYIEEAWLPSESPQRVHQTLKQPSRTTQPASAGSGFVSGITASPLQPTMVQEATNL